MDVVSAVSSSIALVKRLREISKNIEEAEFKNLLADLAGELADVKLEVADLKEKIALLQEENRVLKEVAPEKEQKPISTKWGCYQFEGEDGLFCTGCWDSKRKKIRTNRETPRFRTCPVCNATIGT